MSEHETERAYQVLRQMAALCHAHGVREAVLCPGSRSAPLALTFLRFPDIHTWIIPDERSAAYTALGMAQATRNPVVLVSTSGTAALNFAPAVAEAYWQGLPLMVITADRPPEWIGQADNQAIYQINLYGYHAKWSGTFPHEFTHKDSHAFALRLVNEALNAATLPPFGPVHLNVPLREPLYLTNNNLPEAGGTVPLIQKLRPCGVLPPEIREELKQYTRILVVLGQGNFDRELSEAIQPKSDQFVLIPDVISSGHIVGGALPFYELLIESLKESLTGFQPQLLLTTGGAVVSKALKNFIRNTPGLEHWHIGPQIGLVDTFGKLRRVLEIEPESFFSDFPETNSDRSWIDRWRTQHEKVKAAAYEIFEESDYSETYAVSRLLVYLKQGNLHLGNSLPIRHAAAFPFIKENVKVYGNRGTSGIDGSLSTAVGHSMLSDDLQTLLIGDMSFFYDRNGLWNNYLKPNLKIVMLNNAGGGIFRQLPGADMQPELEEYFVVKQPLNAYHTAMQHGLDYFEAKDKASLEEGLQWLHAIKEKPALLEVKVPMSPTLRAVKNSVLENIK